MGLERQKPEFPEAFDDVADISLGKLDGDVVLIEEGFDKGFFGGVFDEAAHDDVAAVVELEIVCTSHSFRAYGHSKEEVAERLEYEWIS